MQYDALAHILFREATSAIQFACGYFCHETPQVHVWTPFSFIIILGNIYGTRNYIVGMDDCGTSLFH